MSVAAIAAEATMTQPHWNQLRDVVENERFPQQLRGNDTSGWICRFEQAIACPENTVHLS